MKIATKRNVLAFCIHKNQDRLNDIALAMTQAQEAIVNDTKSSAGDKYETSREMVQQDLNRYQEQLLQAKKDALLLQQLPIEPKESASPGAVIVTDSARYFIASSLGKQHIDDIEYMIISAVSPIGRLLLGKVAGDQIFFNGTTQTIQDIY